MLLRLVFLLSLVALVYMALRSRFRRRSPGVARGLPAPPVAWVERRGLPQVFAVGLLSLMLASTGLFLFLEWRDRYQEVRVRVINTGTGASQDYWARRGAIQDRRFETRDGRQVILSSAERLEIGGPD